MRLETYFFYSLFLGVVASTQNDSILEAKIGAFRPKFTEWAKEFEKTYSSPEEELERLLIWIENHEFIETHNTQIPAPSFTMKHNHYSDLTNDEYQKYNKLGSYGKGIISEPKANMNIKDAISVIPTSQQRKLLSKHVDLPQYVNWVEEGAVTGVKNQFHCGSCWSFSAVGAIEGAKYIKDGELVSLSEQMMMDCDPTGMSCEGGIPEDGFKWDHKEGGLCTEEAYPFVAKDRTMCWDANCTIVPDTKVASFVRLNGGSAKELMQSIAIQPTSMAMNGANIEFQFYSEGVFNSTACGPDLNHAILGVGYGHDETTGLDYFLVKNSWGTMWGDKGYFKISMFHEPGGMGICGILNNYNCAPTLAD